MKQVDQLFETKHIVINGNKVMVIDGDMNVSLTSYFDCSPCTLVEIAQLNPNGQEHTL